MADEQVTEFQFNPATTEATPTDNVPDSISWTASEFIAHQKDQGWYTWLVVSSALITGLMYLIVRDIVPTVMIAFGAIIFGIYAGREPRQLVYKLDDSGLHIGSRLYDMAQFRSFGVVPEGAFSSIVLMPLQRFSPPITVYYAPEDEDRIVAILADWVPYAEHQHDMVERLMHRIRF
jgi:hypothetical protein